MHWKMSSNVCRDQKRVRFYLFIYGCYYWQQLYCWRLPTCKAVSQKVHSSVLWMDDLCNVCFEYDTLHALTRAWHRTNGWSVSASQMVMENHRWPWEGVLGDPTLWLCNMRQVCYCGFTLLMWYYWAESERFAVTTKSKTRCKIKLVCGTAYLWAMVKRIYRQWNQMAEEFKRNLSMCSDEEEPSCVGEAKTGQTLHNLFLHNLILQKHTVKSPKRSPDELLSIFRMWNAEFCNKCNI